MSDSEFLAALDQSISAVEERAERLSAACRKLRESHDETRRLLGGLVVPAERPLVERSELSSVARISAAPRQMTPEEEALKADQMRYLESRKAEREQLLARNRGDDA